MKKFIVSGRDYSDFSIEKLKQKNRRFLKYGSIDSVFGFALKHVPLYGGRWFSQSECLSQKHIEMLKSNGIGFQLALSNCHFSEELYKETIPILESLENKRNGVICVNDELAKRVKKDFPLYNIKASGIKRIRTHEKIKYAMDIYDSVTLPPWIVDKGGDFLQAIEEKERIVIFLTMGCGYFCKESDSDRCYRKMSDFNINLQYDDKILPCQDRSTGHRKVPSVFVEMDINSEIFNGFAYFKLIQKVDPDGNASVFQSRGCFSKQQLKKLHMLPIVNV